MTADERTELEAMLRRVVREVVRDELRRAGVNSGSEPDPVPGEPWDPEAARKWLDEMARPKRGARAGRAAVGPPKLALAESSAERQRKRQAKRKPKA